MAEINHFYAEDTTQRTHTGDTNWTDTNTTDGTGKIAGTNLSASTKYLIVAKATLAGDSPDDLFGIRLSCADDSNIATFSEQTMEAYFTEVPYRYFFVWSYTTDASPADIQWQMKTVNSAQEVFVDQCVLWAFEYDSDRMTEAKTTDTTTEIAVDPSWEDMAEITGLDSNEEYLVLGHARIAAGATTVIERVQLKAGSSTTLTYSYRIPEDTADVITHPGYARLSGETSVKFHAAESDASGNHLEAGSYLVAIQTSGFAHFDYAFTAASQGVANSAETIQSVAFTRTNASANHLILGAAQCGTGLADADWYLWNEYNSSPVLAGDSATYLVDGNAASDVPNAVVMSREVFASDATATLRAQTNNAIDRNATYRFLAILDLTLESLAADIQVDYDTNTGVRNTTVSLGSI